jgi:hypothetical protein
MKTSEALSELFRDWNTNSIFCDGQYGPRQQMDVRFCEGRNHGRQAHMRAAGSGMNVLARSSTKRA